MHYVTLNNGVQMPILGFGVFQIPDEKECEASVSAALEVGYRSLDTASLYLNEKAVGNAIASSGISRDELFITTKAWPSELGEEKTLRAFDRSLKKLGVEYLDLYLVHQPFGDYYGAWRAMEKLYAEGRVRAIGVSNFFPDRLTDLIAHNNIVPAVNQVETHPFYQRAEDLELARKHGVQLESWAPFAEGRNELFTNPVLTSIAQAHERSVAQVVLRWLIQREIVVIPKSVRKDRMEENFDVFGFELSADQMTQIAALELGHSQFHDHRSSETVDRLVSIQLDES